MTLGYVAHSSNLRGKPLSFEVFHGYLLQIKGERLKGLMVAINKIMMEEARIEDGKSVRMDSTVVETDIHYPTNNELTWDCIKTAHQLLKDLEERGCIGKVRNYQK